MKRVVVFDNIKFFLIVLMIYGHLMNIGCAVPWKVYNIIYSFHIPLFVLLSGYFTKKHDEKLGRSLLNLFLLYVIFSLISWGVNIFVYHKPAFTSIFRTPFALWYVLCLIYWKIILHYTSEKVLKSWWFFIVVWGASVLPLFFMLDYFSLARCLSFFPYFLLGWLAREYHWIEKLDKIPPSTCQHVGYLMIVLALSVVCSYLATRVPTSFFWGLNPIKYPSSIIICCKALTWGLAIVNSLTVYLLMPKKNGLKEGQYTLFYYLYHTVLLFPVFDLIVKHLPNNFVMSIVVLGCIILSLFLLRKISFLNKLLIIGKDSD